MSNQPLAGKTALVTGASRNIGRAIALKLASAGANIVVNTLQDREAAGRVAAEIEATGRRCIVQVADVVDREAVRRMVGEAASALGSIDILVCNAASNPYYGPMSGLPDDAFQKVLQNNIVANHWLANLVAPEMAQRRDGVIIIVSSIGGIKGTATLGAYAVSKAADMQLARNLAVEWGKHNIRVNCIAPGLVKTDFARALWENAEILKPRLAATPMRRIGEPDEIGGIVAFLASKAASYMTGSVIVADGGVTIA